MGVWKAAPRAVKNFFGSKTIGFIFTAAALVLTFVQFIIYAASFSPPEWISYMHWSVLVTLAAAVVAGIALSIFDVTARWAPGAVTALAFLAFLLFARYGYMYFSVVFYSGFTIAGLFGMYFGYIGSIIFYILIFGLGIAAMFMRQNKPRGDLAKQTADEPKEEVGA